MVAHRIEGGTGGASAGNLADVTARKALVVEPPGAGLVAGGSGTDGSATAAGAASAIAPAVAAVAAKFGYCTGFRVDGLGATGASVITVTLTGLKVGTLSFPFSVPAGAGVAVVPLVVTFPQPLPTNAVNTAVTLNVPSFGAGNTSSIGQIYGYTAA